MQTLRPHLFLRMGLGTAAALLCAPAFAQVPISAAGLPRPSDKVLTELGVSDGTIVELSLPFLAGADLDLELPLDGAVRKLRLWPHSVLADDFRLMVQDPDTGAYESVEPYPSTTYRGVVDGFPESVVAASLYEGQLSAIVKLSNDRPLLGVHPLSDIDPTADVRLHLVYSDADVLETDAVCGVGDAEGDQGGGSDDPSLDGGPTTKIAEIAIDADREFFVLNGSSVSNTQNDITTVMNNVDAIYDNDVDIEYTVTAIHVETSEPDPYSSTSPSTLLNQFRNHWNSQHGADVRDMAHLFTGKNLSGSVIGIAFLNVVCNLSNAYGVSQSRWTGVMTRRTALTAHELGHNWAAGHCDGTSQCRIMCSGLGGCSGFLTSFGPVATNQILNKKNSSTCLDSPPPPAPPIIAGISPGSVEVFGGGVITLTGFFFTDATQVTVGSTILSPPFGFTVVDDNTLQFGSGTPSSLGTFQVTVSNIAGTSNPVNLTYVETDPPKLNATVFGIGGGPFFWSFGSGADDLWFLAASVSNTTVPFLGFDVLASPIFIGAGSLSAIGVDDLTVTAPFGLAGLSVFSQVIVFDNVTFGFVGSSNVFESTFVL